MSTLGNVYQLYNRDTLHLKRKLWHILTGSFGLFLYFRLDIPLDFVRTFCLSLTLAFLVFELLRLNIPSLNNLFIKLASPFMRKSEVKKMTGLPFYTFGIWLSLTCFQLELAILSILFLVFADPLSSLMGVMYGKDKFLPNKSVEGSLTCFIVCYTISFFYLKSLIPELGLEHILFSFVAGLIGATSEILSAFKIDDNLTIPFVSGLGLTYLNQFLNII